PSAVKTYEDEIISIAPSATNEVKHNHTFTATVLINTGDGTGFNPVGAGTIVTMVLTSSLGNGNTITQVTPTTGVVNAATVTYTLTTDINGQVAVTFTSSSAQTVTGSASTTLTIPGGGSITRTTGDGYVVPGSKPPVGDGPNAVKEFVNALISITPATAT